MVPYVLFQQNGGIHAIWALWNFQNCLPKILCLGPWGPILCKRGLMLVERFFYILNEKSIKFTVYETAFWWFNLRVKFAFAFYFVPFCHFLRKIEIELELKTKLGPEKDSKLHISSLGNRFRFPDIKFQNQPKEANKISQDHKIPFNE